MAKRYSSAIVVNGPVPAGRAYAQMVAGALLPISVREILISTRSNIGGEIAISRTFSPGTGAATGIATGINHRMGATTSAQLSNAWTNSGAAPTGFNSKMRQSILPVATGQVLQLWTLDDGPLVLEPGEGIILMNPGSGIDAGSLSVNCTWEEGPASDN